METAGDIRQDKLIEVQYSRLPVLPGILMVVVAIIMFVLAFSLFFAEVSARESQHILKDIKTGGKVGPKDLEWSVQQMNSAVSWLPSNQRYAESKIMLLLGMYEYQSLAGQGNSRKAIGLLTRIDDQIVSALLVSPANSNLWYLLSEVRVRVSPHDKRIYEYLKMSYLTGPHEGWIASRRLAFALQNWNQLDTENRKFALQDIKLLWAEAPYHQYLAKIYSKTTRNGKKIIYKYINNHGNNEVIKFRRVLKKYAS